MYFYRNMTMVKVYVYRGTYHELGSLQEEREQGAFKDLERKDIGFFKRNIIIDLQKLRTAKFDSSVRVALKNESVVNAFAAEFDSVEDAKEKIIKDKSESKNLYCTVRMAPSKYMNKNINDIQIQNSALTEKEMADLERPFDTPQLLYWFGNKIYSENELRIKLHERGMNDRTSKQYLIVPNETDASKLNESVLLKKVNMLSKVR